MLGPPEKRDSNSFKQEPRSQASSSGNQSARNNRGDEENSDMQLRLRSNRGDIEMSIKNEEPSDGDDGRGDSNNSGQSWGSELAKILLGTLEAGVQIFVDFWEWLKCKDEKLWDSDRWEEIVDEGANKAKKSYCLIIDSTTDLCKKQIQMLPEGLRVKAARFFASSIDLVTKFQTTVCENLTIMKDNIGDFLESAWPMLKDIMARIKGTAEKVMDAIRSKLSSESGPETDGDIGIPLLPRRVQ
ncbi:hypothetical protein K440DRAFT_662161 [Wilcoxina mikolae CBS 423.85]|nr:hypothetical protein K440DRAFT_662161 [Wilcoxina mikolae CBS 423.85]